MKILFADGLLISTATQRLLHQARHLKGQTTEIETDDLDGLMITMIMMGETEEKRTSDHSTFSSASHLMLIRIFFLLYFSLNSVQYINSVNYVYMWSRRHH